MPESSAERQTRREFLRLAAASGLGGLLLACGADGDEGPEPPAPATTASRLTTATPTATPRAAARAAAPQAEPRPDEASARELAPAPPRPAGRTELALMRGSEWETPLVAQHSGEPGPSVLVLGGVHGNEPGGWLAAEEIAGWAPARGGLIVIPRANVVATHALERTLPELGDLNRMYPGSFTAELPMARMAAHIIDAIRSFDVELVLDLHESWGFYAERGESGGTAFIGQTITSGPGPDRVPIATPIAKAFNAQVEIDRDHLFARDRTSFPAGFAEGEPLGDGTGGRFWRPGRGGSSLSLGRFVEGVTPVLIEMGQQRQPVARRAELHQLVVRTALEMAGLL